MFCFYGVEKILEQDHLSELKYIVLLPKFSAKNLYFSAKKIRRILFPFF